MVKEGIIMVREGIIMVKEGHSSLYSNHWLQLQEKEQEDMRCDLKELIPIT